MKKILLFSGGLDSYITWRLLERPQPVYFMLGHRYQGAELETIERLKALTPGLDVELNGNLYLGNLEMPDAHIPLRNGLLITLAAATYRPNVIYVSALRGESSRDKSRKFFRNLSASLSFQLNQPVQIATFVRTTKAELVRMFLQRYPDEVDQLKATFSCYTFERPHPRYKGCGRCMACFRRWVAMSLNGIEETYEQSPWTWEQYSTLNWKEGLQALRKAHYAEWPHILVNNAQAIRALRLKQAAGQVG
jgi:7-cyano-7-deazaguanine synthase in queuosine biosynthesis